MNLGMLDLQEELCWTGAPLTDAQRSSLREHPAASVVALRERGVEDPGWLELWRNIMKHSTVPAIPNRLQAPGIVM